ncbi:hypothetical protein [Pseudomonas sp. BF-R-01]|uniref:hypothetical protein n=1 Tax=Pseudomonas sp. BF-R-01 TaxID=2832365 RepID=UPI001CC13D17|nr:hypothetical protein [Pseudomonas sp. BF-R-01]
MTTIQICALIALIALVGLTYWTGYRNGLIDGRIEGVDEGKAIQHSENSETIQDLQRSVDQANATNKQLSSNYEYALATSKLGEPERQTLLAIAEQLRIAAETFSAFRTGKKLERDTVALRDQALALATLLKPVVLENAA